MKGAVPMFDSEEEAVGFFQELMRESNLTHWDTTTWDERTKFAFDTIILRGAGRRGIGVRPELAIDLRRLVGRIRREGEPQ